MRFTAHLAQGILVSDDLNRVACFENKDAIVYDGASASLEIEFLVYDYVTSRPILAT